MTNKAMDIAGTSTEPGQYWAKCDGVWKVVNINDEGDIFLPFSEISCFEAGYIIDELGDKVVHPESEHIGIIHGSANVKEVRRAADIAEAKINNVLAQLSHDYCVNDLTVDVDITRLFVEGSKIPAGLGAHTTIKIRL